MFGYQYVTEQKLTIHSEDNSNFSNIFRLDILFDENPSVDTLKKIGWVSELNEQKPIIANLPYDTPNLTVNARIIIESTDGISRQRLFKITKIQSDLEFPDAFTCALVPVFDQFPQNNHYAYTNTEKISEVKSERTSDEEPYMYISDGDNLDTTPSENIEAENNYVFINDDNSPYSG